MTAVSETRTPAAPALPRPDAVTLAAFAGVVLITGGNPTILKISYRELAPFWGAALRFGTAAVLLYGIAVVRRIPFPRGRALAGCVLFGLLGCFGAYSFIYVALRHLHASLAAPIMASVPLLTFFLAITHRVERFRWRGLIGGLTSAAGIVVLSGAGSSGGGPVKYMLFVLVASACAAEAGIVVKKFPHVHPFMMNAVAFGIAAPLFYVASLATREAQILPHHAKTWASLAYLIGLGSVTLFVLYVLVVSRWTVTGASYQFVLFPIVAVLVASWIGNEPITASLGVGASLVLAGVYVGALSGHRRTHPPPTTHYTHVATAPPC